MTSDAHTSVIALSLPAGVAGFAVLEAVTRALLQRTEGVADAEAMATRLLERAASTGSDSAAEGALWTVRFVVAPDSLRLDVAGVTVLSEPLAQPLTETDAEVDAGFAMPRFGPHLIHRLMDETDAWRSDAGAGWRLVKHLSAADAPPDAAFAPLTVEVDLPAQWRYFNVVGAALEATFRHAGLSAEGRDAVSTQLAVQEVLLLTAEQAPPAALADGQPPRVLVTLRLETPDRFVVETADAGPLLLESAAVADVVERAPTPRLRGSLLSAGALLFASATLVNAGNYLFNLLLGRFLGPAAFADLSLIVTLFLISSFVTAGLMMPVARFTARFAADGDTGAIAGLRRWAGRWALVVGLGLLVLFAGGAPLWNRFFSTASPWPFVILGLLVPFYVVQGVDRGVLQGRTRFTRLALTYQTEMWSRLVLSLVLVSFGFAVNGAVFGIGLSFVATWLVARTVAADLPPAKALPTAMRSEVLIFVAPVLVAQLGQILINNSDVLIVRRFFPADEAGLYAALALIGRIVFFATWSVVTVLFPIVAQRHRRGEPHRRLLYAGLGAVLAVSLTIVGVTWFFPTPIVGLLFGEAYLGIAPLLWVYAVATMFYALANVVVNYRLSLNHTGGTYLTIVAGVAQVAVLWLMHDSLAQVVWVQVGLMAGLFVALMGWELLRMLGERRMPAPAAAAG